MNVNTHLFPSVLRFQPSQLVPFELSDRNGSLVPTLVFLPIVMSFFWSIFTYFISLESVQPQLRGYLTHITIIHDKDNKIMSET